MREREGDGERDERLGLLFACAHPAIDPAIRTPLMLQAVLGLDAGRIAAAFAVAPAAMAQRLVRAKAKIKAAGVPFAPEPDAAPERLGDVLAAVYAAYGAGWDAIGAEGPAAGLATEAIWLGRLLVALAPEAAEPKGLLALMLYAEARAPARRSASGAYVPLSAQDRALWRGDMIAEAEGLLEAAARMRAPGRFQIEAAIQSLHITAPRGAEPDPRALRFLYGMLAERHPTLGALVGHALAVAALEGPEAGLRLLDGVAGAEAYQPWWAARLALLRRAGDARGAEAARARALALTRDEATREFLGTC